MRIRQFTPPDGKTPRVGVHTAPDKIIDLEQAGRSIGVDLPSNTRALLENPRWKALSEVVADHGSDAGSWTYDVENVTTNAPIGDPEKIICVGLNYAEHAEEGDQEIPDEPLLFSKYPSSIIGPEEPITWDPSYTNEVDYEVELAAVIGEETRRVSAENALDVVAGLTVSNDVSARDLQFNDDQWVRGKSLDTFCPLGPELVTLDDINDPHDLQLWAEVNGERVQDSTTSDLIRGVPELVSFASDAFTLSPGDLILTGTPPGVGVFRDPQILLGDGDTVTVGVEGIGTVRNPCRHE
ncbi:MAG: fumarylacetoacetate hydrolase family protein [Halorubrum sp.]